MLLYSVYVCAGNVCVCELFVFICYYLLSGNGLCASVICWSYPTLNKIYLTLPFLGECEDRLTI